MGNSLDDIPQRRLAPLSRVFDVEQTCLPGMVFHPLAPLHLQWDFLILLLALAAAFYIPFRISFQIISRLLE
jgi:hypothetical protein